MIARLIEEKENENEPKIGGIRCSRSFCWPWGIGRGILFGGCTRWEKAIQDRSVGRKGTRRPLDAPS